MQNHYDDSFKAVSALGLNESLIPDYISQYFFYHTSLYLFY